ncbi:Non-canonical purine NTP phosphatase [Candidatus Anstonella stagnisolia]|nr:Non-canonical purine NTP phosphatase [Candidatus Anstonella stagnisolia]
MEKIVVAVGSKNSTKIEGARRALKRVLGKSAKVRIVPVAVSSGVPSQPFGHQTIRGAIRRAKRAYAEVEGAKYGIGFESGLFEFDSKLFDIAFCALYDGKGYTLGNSMGFAVPGGIEKKLRGGKADMGSIVAKISGIKGIGSRKGAIHFLSGGMMHRREMNEQALCCAFIPRIAKKKGIV